MISLAQAAVSVIVASLSVPAVASVAQAEQEKPRTESAEKAKKRTEKKRQVSGTVIDSKTVQLRGSNVQNRVVLLKTSKEDRRLPVDLGPASAVKGVNTGEKIQVEGVVVRVGDRQMLVANRVKDDGKVTNIDRMQQIQQFKTEKQAAEEQSKPSGPRRGR